MPALQCAPFRPRVHPPLISLHSVAAFCSLLARFGAGFSLVLLPWHVPLGHPQRPPRKHCSTLRHKPAIWVRGDRESLMWGDKLL